MIGVGNFSVRQNKLREILITGRSDGVRSRTPAENPSRIRRLARRDRWRAAAPAV